MTRANIHDSVLRALAAVAPEIDVTSVGEDQPLRDSLDLDSMDLLNLIISLGRELHLDVPESDYSKLQTVAGMVSYFCERARAA
jgi:acyl carrier protein